VICFTVLHLTISTFPGSHPFFYSKAVLVWKCDAVGLKKICQFHPIDGHSTPPENFFQKIYIQTCGKFLCLYFSLSILFLFLLGLDQ